MARKIIKERPPDDETDDICIFCGSLTYLNENAERISPCICNLCAQDLLPVICRAVIKYV